ncbi:Chitin binding protein [Mycena indigotica]|uniref:Chitin binding protein n=1 Tax=Mycena indigotica TaxID=2126181 RepID=A0A8H6SX72_9AGAR|nr:Chitin binding protein [Mycena indigotica]KAF7306923.1 Chitin binding protein [Mycena indigotica]
MFCLVTLVPLLALVKLPAVWGHALITSPAIRTPGPAFQKACGVTSFNAVKNGPDGHIEEQEPVPQQGCELTLCRGMLFADQPSSHVLTVKPLQRMQMDVDCTVPHGGPANVSLIDTTVGGSGAYIGSFLKTFDDFCPTSGQTPADQTNLQYALPDAATIGDKCQRPGQCVVQLFWATPEFDQNYYYCVDVVMAATQPTTSSTPIVVRPTTSTKPVAPTTSLAKMITSVVSSAKSANTGIAAAANANNGTIVKTNAGRGTALVNVWIVLASISLGLVVY